MNNLRLIVVLAALAGGAILGTVGAPDRRIGLSSVFDLWTDVLRDAYQVPLIATRVNDAEEMRLGDEIAKSVLSFETEDASASAYVTDVASRLVPHVQRTGIRYTFHVIESPAINAFALPGGHVFVLRGLLDFAGTEAELATALGHEISHVDLRHCIERYQYELQLKKLRMPAAGWTLEFAHRVFTMSFGPRQELDADAAGERLAVEAGYNPNAAASLFWRMQKANNEPARATPATPGGEVAATVSGALSGFFRSHPPSQDRAGALRRMVARNNERFAGRQFYDGAKNVKQHMARSRREYADEFRKL